MFRLEFVAAGVACKQEMLTLPRHLFSPLAGSSLAHLMYNLCSCIRVMSLTSSST